MAETIEQTGGRFILLNWDDSVAKTGSSIIDQHIAANKVSQVVSPAGGIVLPVWSVISRSKQEYFILHDGHPSALANKVLADYLAKNVKF